MVTGGAGYIGAHTSRLLLERGDEVFIVDDLVTGFAERVPGVPLLQIDLADPTSRQPLTEFFRRHSIDAVIHFAARKQVAESVARPAWYYQQNVGGLAQLLMAMEDAGVGKLVFSSSAAVYGAADGAIDEAHDTRPVSPYGATKLAGEQLIESSSRAWNLSAVSLRYFNVGGAGWPELGDTETSNLIPIVQHELESGRPPQIFGNDYPTPDGTCLRDYIHVLDVAEAHLAVLDTLPVEAGHRALNVGTGIGTSVLEIVSRIIAVAGSDLVPVSRPRRAGDAAAVVALVERIANETGWQARFSLEDIIESSWASQQHFRTLSPTAGLPRTVGS